MKLEKIKLSGFKSFVDPTTILLSSHLVGVVGPNGCGKSNIIDAVRWVMGESSAKQLRGEQITDVIFTGSLHRQPVGQAAVELIFNNQDGSLGSEFAQYRQISIKRRVNREGQSVYSLNGTRCRRRDIMDVFWGTGLGPRGHSIIEQGLVSKIIESKPEELRVYLEEVAGISKYKERRRETENRIRSTNENLLRINDLRVELEKRLEHLKRQAKAAKRFQTLRSEERQTKALLTAFQWQQLQTNIQTEQQQLAEQETTLLSIQTQLQHCDTQLEKQKIEQSQAHEAVNKTQEQYYQTGNEIARLEQTIQFRREQHQKALADFNAVVQDLEQFEISLTENQTQLLASEEQKQKLTPLLNSHREMVTVAQEKLSQAEEGFKFWNQKWEAFLETSSTYSHDLQLKQARLKDVKYQEVALEKQLSGLLLEQDNLSDTIAAMDLKRVSEELNRAKVLSEEYYQSFLTWKEQLNATNHEYQSLTGQLKDFEQTWHEKHESIIALKTLQEAALGQSEDQVKSFLVKHQFDKKQRLAQHLKVKNGWECAVETVLENYLDAVCVDDFTQDLPQIITDLKAGRLTLMDGSGFQEKSATQRLQNYNLLKGQVSVATGHLLDGIYIAETLEEAIKNRYLLESDESFITKEGVWVGRYWIRLMREMHQKTGMIEREKNIQLLDQELARLAQKKSALEEKIQTTQATQSQLRSQETHLQNQWYLAKDQYQKLQTQYELAVQKQEQSKERLSQLGEAIQQKTAENVVLSKTENDLTEALALLSQRQDVHQKERGALLKGKEQIESLLRDSRFAYQKQQDLLHQTELKNAKLQSEIQHLKDQANQLEQRRNILLARRLQMQNQLEVTQDAAQNDMQEQLNTLLNKRLEQEKNCDVARQQLNHIDFGIQTVEKDRQKQAQAMEEVRRVLEVKRVALQESKTRQQTLEENLSKHQENLETLLDQLTDEMTEAEFEHRLNKLGVQIQRLGLVNLAAITEYDQVLERHTYLDEQYRDLEEALETLQTAIRKIDRQTRVQFKQTFDQVNQHFMALFPKVFGGGKASLELTSEDLLDTGVRIIAKPPGKHIQNIQLMSGGEKALIGITLVFALFRFHPSPFCMLDEVDAPLDDANVLRFCDLVKEMAKDVQFIFITHNKVTMEMASHLMGITMHEPGVSRIVAVDVDQAVKISKK